MTARVATHADPLEGGSDRLHELLADRATFGLSAPEHEELLSLLERHPDVDATAYDWAAAAIDLPAALHEAEPMPDTLRAEIDARAVAWLATSLGMRTAGGPPPRAATAHGRPSFHAERPAATAAAAGSFAWIPWVLAAACLALALSAWWPSSRPAPPPAREYARLASLPGSTLVAWNDAASLGVQGDIVWNGAEQTGVMRFTGLAANDPTKQQYQLWIFDKGRKAFTEFDAVDGGVFDVASDGDAVYVKVSPKLSVSSPYLFAVTTEPPGGVVKHVETGDYRIILTAPSGA